MLAILGSTSYTKKDLVTLFHLEMFLYILQQGFFFSFIFYIYIQAFRL